MEPTRERTRDAERGRPRSGIRCRQVFGAAPPLKQIKKDAALGWARVNPERARLARLLFDLRTVRSNLFHGGKFPDGFVEEPSRDEHLIGSCLGVLNALFAVPPCAISHYISHRKGRTPTVLASGIYTYTEGAMMIIYLAGNPAEHEQFNRYAAELEADGHQVLSTWHRSDAVAQMVAAARDQQQAMSNLVLNLFTFGPEADEERLGSVPRGPSEFDLSDAADRFRSELDEVEWVMAQLPAAALEVGYAIAKGKRVIAIGSSESLMIPLFGNQVELVADWGAARGALFGRRMRRILGRSLSVHENA